MNTPPPGFVPSPCTGECRLDAQQLCTGCRRHAREIAEWPAADSLRRAEIRQAALRRSLAGQAPGHGAGSPTGSRPGPHADKDPGSA